MAWPCSSPPNQFSRMAGTRRSHSAVVTGPPVCSTTMVRRVAPRDLADQLSLVVGELRGSAGR